MSEIDAGWRPSKELGFSGHGIWVELEVVWPQSGEPDKVRLIGPLYRSHHGYHQWDPGYGTGYPMPRSESEVVLRWRRVSGPDEAPPALAQDDRTKEMR